MRAESFLPKKAFAGSDKHKLGTKGQARGEPGRSQKAPLTGLMVGEEIRPGDYVLYVDGKAMTHYQHKHRAEADAEVLKNKFPNRRIEVKLAGTSEAKQRLDPKCWKGYRKQGTKMKGGVRVNNCVKVGESWENKISNLISLLESK